MQKESYKYSNKTALSPTWAWLPGSMPDTSTINAASMCLVIRNIHVLSTVT